MQAHLVFAACICDNYQNLVPGPHSAVCNMSGNRYESDCRSSGRESIQAWYHTFIEIDY